jgi:osmotically-inducible protein OsmY
VKGTVSRRVAQISIASMACVMLLTSCTASQQQRARNDVGDAFIAGQIRARLATLDPATVSLIKIGVQNRAVTLDGQVHSRQERLAIDNAARSVSGVTRVDDHLVVNPKAPTAQEIESDLELQAKVKTALTEQTGVNAMKVQVSAHSGVVDLEGTVPTPALHTVEVQTARSVPGVRRVLDHLRNAR